MKRFITMFAVIMILSGCACADEAADKEAMANLPDDTVEQTTNRWSKDAQDLYDMYWSDLERRCNSGFGFDSAKAEYSETARQLAYINSSLNNDATVSSDLVEVAEAFESAECDK